MGKKIFMRVNMNVGECVKKYLSYFSEYFVLCMSLEIKKDIAWTWRVDVEQAQWTFLD